MKRAQKGEGGAQKVYTRGAEPQKFVSRIQSSRLDEIF